MKDKKYLNIAMLGHKRIPSREGGVEIVVEELSARMANLGHHVTCYNRGGARKYEMGHINKAIYMGNYLEGGLKNNRCKHNIVSQVGCVHRAEAFMEPDLKTKYRTRVDCSISNMGNLHVLVSSI